MYTQQKELGRGWKPGEVEQFYLEMRQVGRMYGVREQDMPENWAAFCTWFDEMTRTRLERSDMTDRVFGVVTSPPPHIPVLRHALVWNTTVRPVAGLVLATVTAGLLTPELRELLGIDWGTGRRVLFRLISLQSRLVIPRLPRAIRMVPHARAAYR
ncbi:oxygenase MpaB family protein [Gordonia amicalis]|uniref:oxygenase MpaB family protein n=1 Tax=Gordonia amicalis TaxID=89053 RepID=UPI0037BF3AAF